MVLAVCSAIVAFWGCWYSRSGGSPNLESNFPLLRVVFLVCLGSSAYRGFDESVFSGVGCLQWSACASMAASIVTSKSLAAELETMWDEVMEENFVYDLKTLQPVFAKLSTSGLKKVRGLPLTLSPVDAIRAKELKGIAEEVTDGTGVSPSDLHEFLVRVYSRSSTRMNSCDAP